jgi:succinyl-CoA synthetase alpha subunit
MSILVDAGTKAVIQGITGESGQRFVTRMAEFGSPPVAGVTPGKGGQEVMGVPVYDTVAEACRHHPIDFSSINVPPAFVKDAVMESIDAGIRKIFIYAERVPLHDALEMMDAADELEVTIVGPNTPGIVSPGKYRLGGLGGGKDYVREIFTPGPVGLVSRSGGMTSTLGYTLSRAGLGQTTAFGCGGDAIIGTPFDRALALFEADPDTKCAVMFGEIGTSYEEDAAEMIGAGGFTKPVVAFIAGRHALAGFRFGHAGALIERGRGTYESKVEALRGAGVAIAATIREIPELVKQALARRG